MKAHVLAVIRSSTRDPDAIPAAIADAEMRRAKCAAARRECEPAMAGSAAAHAIQIERGSGFLHSAEADLRNLP